MTTECFYEDVKVGDKGTSPQVTVTREMIGAYADLTGDHTPIHVDEDYARSSIFGGIVAHGSRPAGWCIVRAHFIGERRGVVPAYQTGGECRG